MIHIFGDSHGEVFHRPFTYTYHYVGSVTMHRVGRDGSAIFDDRKVWARPCAVKHSDTVIFVFGEIDVRCHIGKQRDEKRRQASEIIETLLSRYIKAIEDYRRKFRNLNCIVQLVVPPTDRLNHPDYPLYGSLEDRIGITKTLNEKLAARCREHGITVLDVTGILSIEDGRLDPKRSDGTVHAGKHVLGFYEAELLDCIPRREKLKIRFRQAMDWMRITRIWHLLRGVGPKPL